MPTFKPGDLIKVPFPYTDRPVRQRRPAFVLATADLQADHGMLWVLMVTSADNKRWPSDVVIADHAGAGLPAPSVVRTAKIATIEAEHAELLGKAPPSVAEQVLSTVRARIGS
ncbi:MAG TPA: type II toxin-antitoxin system PemK/MazF family toxin [Solirubrobacterales bacterium]|nr:type II toxin-antitoxin system PemK/MazF family toxin [Solirubrobacterales bacterium]